MSNGGGVPRAVSSGSGVSDERGRYLRCYSLFHVSPTYSPTCSPTCSPTYSSSSTIPLPTLLRIPLPARVHSTSVTALERALPFTYSRTLPLPLSNQDELSAASTHAAATLQLHLRPEATDAHIENLTGLNDKASAAASALTQRPTPEAPTVATHW